ncbi:transcription elongation factor GreA [Patescibacteria group bacterium]|nr:transcription elongation factor GreA [Patescibacteria group bacterium]
MDSILNKQIQITKNGLDSLGEELNGLKNEKRPKLVNRLAYARSQGDLSENSDYQNARDELEFLDGRISELEGVLKNAVVVRGGGKRTQVAFGTKVTLKTNGKKHVFEIVGEWEADPAEKKISHTSPIGKALIGKKVGDKAQVEAPAGKITYQILSID